MLFPAHVQAAATFHDDKHGQSRKDDEANDNFQHSQSPKSVKSPPRGGLECSNWVTPVR
jgi:hypothetical protein